MKIHLSLPALLATVLCAGCGGTARHDGAGGMRTTGAGGVPIAWEAAGRPAGGPSLVLIHGWNCDRRYWQEPMRLLAQHFRVVAVDLGGHGESGSGREDWSVASFGVDVAAVVRRLDLDRVVLVGHSMGGPVALEAAGRLAERVVGVIGVDTFHASDDAPPADLDARLQPFREDLPTALGLLDPIFFAPATDPALAEWIRTDMAAAPPKVAVPALASLARYHESSALAALDAPVGVINADLQATDVAALRRARPGIDVVVMEDAGHFLMMERPEAFVRELRRLVDRWTSVMPGS